MLNKETEQLKREFGKLCNCSTLKDDDTFEASSFTIGELWQFIEKALTNQTTTLKKKIEKIQTQPDVKYRNGWVKLEYILKELK